jgi:hypothetical protein
MRRAALCILILLTAAGFVRGQESPDSTEYCGACRTHHTYIEIGASLAGQMESSRLVHGSYTLKLRPDYSIPTDGRDLPDRSGSISFEIGIPISQEPIWLFGGAEFHPRIDAYDLSGTRYYGDSAAWIGHKTLRGMSVYAGALFEKKLLPFFGVYGKLYLGYFQFSQTVLVVEYAGTQISATVYSPDIANIGGGLNAGLFFDFWGVKIRGGYRAFSVSSRRAGSILSQDIRMALSLGF